MCVVDAACDCNSIYIRSTESEKGNIIGCQDAGELWQNLLEKSKEALFERNIVQKS